MLNDILIGSAAESEVYKSKTQIADKFAIKGVGNEILRVWSRF